MKIAILVPNFVEFDGGARVARIQAEELAEQGNYVAIFTFAADMKPKNACLFVMGMPQSLFWQRIYRLVFPLDVFKTIKWLRKLRTFDQVLVHLYPLTWLGYWAKRLYGIGYTFWFHGLEEPRLFPLLSERIYMRAQIFLTRQTVRNVDRAVSVSRFAQAKLKEYTGLDSEVIYNRVDTSKFRKELDGSKIREKYDIGDAPLILNVGRITPQKGVDKLIEAFKLIRNEMPSARLMIVGDFTFHYYTEKLRQMSDDGILFTGHVKHDELPYYYAACDIYATCSLWENHNLPVEEAQACGKPVVAFNIAPFREAVGDKGTLVETGNVEMFARACLNRIKQVRQGERVE